MIVLDSYFLSVLHIVDGVTFEYLNFSNTSWIVTTFIFQINQFKMDQDGSRVPMKMGDFSVIDSEFNNIRERYASIITSSDARHQSNHNPIAIK